MRSKLIRISLLASLLGGACRGATEGQPPLIGEWTVSFHPSEQRDGVMVFHREIPCYCVDPTDVPSDAVIGRAYLNLEAIGQSPRRVTDSYFAVDRDADYYEEAVGVMAGQRIAVNFRGPAGPQFSGILEGDSIRGTWVYAVHGETVASGEFLMRRSHLSAYSDSARIRSRRGVRNWMNEPPIVPTEPVDTAPK